MYQLSYPNDLFSELVRAQRVVQDLFGHVPSIRGVGSSSFPLINVGNTSNAMEVFAFAPGLDPAKIEVQFERGVLTISGERPQEYAKADSNSALRVNERFSGHYARAVSLPDDLDPEQVTAKYSDGILHITVKRREATQPRRIEVNS